MSYPPQNIVQKEAIIVWKKTACGKHNISQHVRIVTPIPKPTKSLAPRKKKGGGAEKTFYLFRRHETLNLSMVLIKASIQKNQERGGDLLYLGTMEEDL